MSKTITSGQPFQNPQGTAFANGFLILTLSQPAEITSGGGQVAPKVVSITLDANGKIPGSTTILASDELTPSGTTYTAELLDSGGNIITNFGQWSIAGASPIDVSTIIPTTTGASYPSPVLLSPSGAQEITAGNLTIDQSLIVKNGTAFGLTLGGTPTAARTATFPDNTGTVAELNLVQTFSAAQTFSSATTTGALSVGTTITNYNGVATAGQGVPPIVAATFQRTESAADSNLLTYTPPATAGTYRVRFVLSVSAANTATLGWTATWKDAGGTTFAPTNLSIFQIGVAAPALTFGTSSAIDLYGDLTIDIDNSATAIVVKLTFSGTSFTAKASATIERLQ